MGQAATPMSIDIEGRLNTALVLKNEAARWGVDIEVTKTGWCVLYIEATYEQVREVRNHGIIKKETFIIPKSTLVFLHKDNHSDKHSKNIYISLQIQVAPDCVTFSDRTTEFSLKDDLYMNGAGLWISRHV